MMNSWISSRGSPAKKHSPVFRQLRGSATGRPELRFATFEEIGQFIQSMTWLCGNGLRAYGQVAVAERFRQIRQSLARSNVTLHERVDVLFACARSLSRQGRVG